MVSTLKRTAIVLAGAGALMVVAPGGALAAGPAAPAEPLSVEQATKAQRKAARTGHYPPGPRIPVKGLERERLPRGGESTPPADAKRVRINTRKAKRLWRNQRSGNVRAKASLFGYHGDFFAKRNTILSYVNGYYAERVSAAGGTFADPALYEVNDDTTTLTCGGQSQLFRQNAAYCPGGNFVIWSLELSQSFWNQIGDNAWATVIAHEYGHGAQQWLGYGDRGYFGYVIYRETFADCLAGAWYFSMYQRGLGDDVGVGDGNELRGVIAAVSDDVTQWDNHGDFNWRYGAAIHGWNYGFDGCVNWGNWIYNH